MHVFGDGLGVDPESVEAREKGHEGEDEGTSRGGRMGEDNYPSLMEDGFPNFVEIGDSKEIDNDFEVTADVEVVELNLGPGIIQVLAHLFVGHLNDIEVGEVLEEGLDGGGEPDLEVAEEWDLADNCNSLLDIGPGEIGIVLLHLLSQFDLLEVGHAE